MFGKFWELVSFDIGIDLGTVNTLVLVKDKGIVIREPTVVALHKKTRQILAIGSEAKRMLGRTPISIEAVRPLRDGVISDFDTTEAMLKFFIQKVHQTPKSAGWHMPKLPRPRVVVGIPSGVTEVERRAVQDACLSAGAREAYLIEEPMAAAIGSKLAIEEPEGSMIVDIGGGTTEIAVISLGGMVLNRSLRVAGDELDEAIINYLRMRYGLLIGEKTAEDVKMEVGSAHENWAVDKRSLTSDEDKRSLTSDEDKRSLTSDEDKRSLTSDEDKTNSKLETVVRGRDLATGLPKSLKITEVEVREALTPIINEIVGAIHEVLEETPPELLSDIVERGIVLAGGGALIRGLDKKIAEETKLPVWVADDPLTAVVRGCGKVLENLDLLAKVKVTGGLR